MLCKTLNRQICKVHICTCRSVHQADCILNHQLFADDTQLQKSAPASLSLSEVTNLTKELNACRTDDIKTWMTENQLKLNDDRTEALLFPLSSSLKPSTVSLPDSITLGSHNIPPFSASVLTDSARNPAWIHS